MPKPSTFTQRRTLTSSSLAHSTLDLLHDHLKLMQTQPLVAQIESLDSGPSRAPDAEKGDEYDWYRQTEFVKFCCGLITKKVVFENWFRDLDTSAEGEGGVESKVYVTGLQIKATFRVQRAGGKGPDETIHQRETRAQGKDGSDAEDEGEGEDQRWELIEEAEMKCHNVLVKWLSEGQYQRAHREMLDRIVLEARKGAALEGR